LKATSGTSGGSMAGGMPAPESGCALARVARVGRPQRPLGRTGREQTAKPGYATGRTTRSLPARGVALGAFRAVAPGGPAPPPPPPPPADAPVALPAFLSAALADANRPEADRARDAARHPGELLMFAGLKPGMKVVDLIPGSGYFTRIFAKAVGPSGRVYAYVPDELTAIAKGRPPSVAAFAGKAPYANTVMVLQTLPLFGAPQKVDLVFTAQNYHDMHLPFMGPADLSVVNRRVFEALKPGGVYLVIDHSAKAGSGLRDSDSLHRLQLKAPDGLELTWNLRTELGAGPLALLKLRGFNLPQQIFLSENDEAVPEAQKRRLK